MKYKNPAITFPNSMFVLLINIKNHMAPIISPRYSITKSKSIFLSIFFIVICLNCGFVETEEEAEKRDD